MIRMILADLDHTLLRQDGSISEKTLQILLACRAKGIRFAIAMARYWIGAERYIDLMNLDFEITTDGTLIHSHAERIYVSMKSMEINYCVFNLSVAILAKFAYNIIS